MKKKDTLDTNSEITQESSNEAGKLAEVNKLAETSETKPDHMEHYRSIFPEYVYQAIHDFSEGQENGWIVSKKRDLKNFGRQVAAAMFFYLGEEDIEEDYQTACNKVKQDYKSLIEYIEQLKRTTSPEKLAANENYFFRSIDTFLAGILEYTSGDEILSDVTTEESIREVAVCHDCIVQTYHLLNDKEIFILGDLSDN